MVDGQEEKVDRIESDDFILRIRCREPEKYHEQSPITSHASPLTPNNPKEQCHLHRIDRGKVRRSDAEVCDWWIVHNCNGHVGSDGHSLNERPY